MASLLIRLVLLSQGYFLTLLSAAFSFSSNHANSATTLPSTITTLSSILLRPLHLWFHTDLLIFVCNFDYVLHLIKPWFILCVRIVFSATLVTFEGYTGRSSTGPRASSSLHICASHSLYLRNLPRQAPRVPSLRAAAYRVFRVFRAEYLAYTNSFAIAWLHQ